VSQGGLGPFDYAVLKADTADEMIAWLGANRYVAPPGSDAVIGRYLHAGAYFLALRLKSGESSGAIQPVKVVYQSDLPMIPLVLTSVAAAQEMGVLVWVLGDARAVPRNYHHVVLDQAALDWNDSLNGYDFLVRRAVLEAPEHHGFVTDYAGTSSGMRGVLDASGRFGDPNQLRTLTSAYEYILFLRRNGFSFSSPLLGILQKYIPEPASLLAEGTSPADFYSQDPNSSDFLVANFDPAPITDEIEMRVVQPTLAEGQLFVDRPYLTRLYTRLAPADMTDDPVFAENPDLPDVSRFHTATDSFDCNGNETLITEDGQRVPVDGATASRLPASLRIERIGQSGAPVVETDNDGVIASALGQGGGGCAIGERRRLGGAALELVLFVLGARALRRRRAAA
jgi:hypothetical protein